MSFGPNPWQQQNWDARAAANFIGGGAGCGLLVFTALAGAEGALRPLLIVTALVLVAAGLASVWAEIGRPWRAMNVVFNPRSSWMSRESLIAPLLFGAGAAALAWPGLLPLAALLAAGFLVCQAFLLQAAKGIPAWREPWTVALLIATGLAEGAGLYWLAAPWFGQGGSGALLAFGALLAARLAIGMHWHRRLASRLRPAALRAVDRVVPGFSKAGSLAPLVLVLIALIVPLPAPLALLLKVAAGALAVAGGALFKYRLVVKAGFNQGFALPHLPVRGRV